jgi:hypothetical protein
VFLSITTKEGIAPRLMPMVMDKSSNNNNNPHPLMETVSRSLVKPAKMRMTTKMK